MEITYKYIPSADYINELTFDYFETYSLQRGKEYEERLAEQKEEYKRLKAQKEKQDNLDAESEDRYNELTGLLGFTQYLLNSEGKFHPSAHKSGTFKFNDPEVAVLRDILRTEIIDIPRFLCAPVYRDAIVFYDSMGNIVSTLNVCLSCKNLELKQFVHLDADWKTYDLLRRFFMDIGHNVENDKH